MSSMKGQLSLRGIVIGLVGCAIISAASVYTALKMGALPWPIIFAAIVSLFLLRVFSKGKATLNEANVTHTIMSSGAMVAGGLAFTIPGAWMCGLVGDISMWQVLVLALCGSALGLLGSVALRRHFVEDVSMEFPIGQAAAMTLKAGDTGGKVGGKLFGSMGLAAVYAFLRDGLAVIPSTFANLAIPGVTFCIYNSPMMLAVGFLVGTGAVFVWFAGAFLANFGIIVGFPALGLTTTEVAQTIVSCLGMGMMMGAGIGVVVRDVLPKGIKSLSDKFRVSAKEAPAVGLTANGKSSNKSSVYAAAFVILCVMLALCILLDFPFWVSLICVVLAFVTCAMSSQSVGQTGIDPMEIFGLIVLLLVAAVGQIAQVKLFFVACLIAVACGLAGDVMNDFKAGAMLGTSPRAQWVGQAIGAVVGSVVSVCVMWVLLGAYGADAFGPGQQFVSAQASVVAALVTGIGNVPAFVIGLVLGLGLYMFRFPSMMLGLGVYLPFYMSFTAFLGALVKVIYDMICKRRNASLTDEQIQSKQAKQNDTALLLASGLLGGESIMGILIALVASAGAFLA